MTFQRKLLLGFLLMVLPVLFVGAEAIRSNALERRALESLGESLSRTRTYAELETAMFDQSGVLWRHLSGLDPGARREFGLSGEVVNYWLTRWRAELGSDEMALAESVGDIQRQIAAVGDSVFALTEQGERTAAYALATRELRERLEPALTQVNREVYRRARESSVRGGYARLEEILADERRVLVVVSLLALAAGVGGWWLIARSVTRPLNELRQAIGVVGAGDLDHPIVARSSDEIGELATAFAATTARLKESRTAMVDLNAALEAKIGQLERTQAQLVQSEKLASIGEMAAAVAHGLRNPLASLRAAAQFVRRHPESAAAREQLEAIIDQVDRLDRRITHLLAFARPAPFRPVPESVVPLTDGLVGTFAELARAKDVDFVIDVPEDLPGIVIDPLQVEQALVELVSNALDATRPGGKLTVRAASRREPDGDRVAIEVRDTGPGIPADVLPSVCEPFFTTRAEGTGLGLAIARRYIEQNGGRLEISSAVGQGTVATASFPAARVDAPLAARVGAAG